jgi:hypothetical protein
MFMPSKAGIDLEVGGADQLEENMKKILEPDKKRMFLTQTNSVALSLQTNYTE